MRKKKIHRSVINKQQIVNINRPTFGNFIIYSKTNCLITSNQIESIRIIISRTFKSTINNNKFKKKIKLVKHYKFCLQFNKPFTKKSSKSRMGKGKGSIDTYKALININTPLIVFKNLPLKFLLNIFKKIKFKLSFPIFKIIY